MTTPYQPGSFNTTAQLQPSASLSQKIIPKLVVEIFQGPFFQGTRGIVIDNVPFTGDIGFQDNIFSVRVYKGPGFATNPSYKVILHEDRDYRGRQLILGPGYYPALPWIAYNFGGIISSISFGSVSYTSGPEFGTVPLIVEVFKEIDFKGNKAVVLRDVNNTEQIGLQDAISSIRVFRGPDFPPSGCKAIFYEHIEYDGTSLELGLGPLEYHKEIPNLYTHPRFFGGVISSIKLESWASGGSGKFKDVVFLDEFDTIKPIWRWIDPRGDCLRQVGQPMSGGILQARQGWLEMHVGANHDLWWGPNGQGGNMDAPRMVQPISGDFAIEVKLTCSAERKEHGGILVWANENQFIRLDKTSALHAFRGDIRFETHIRRMFNLIGRGQQNSLVNYLRLERTGHEFQAFCSVDGQEWQSCGTTQVILQDPVMVGMHALCPGSTPPTVTRFDYFKIMRPVAATNLSWTSRLATYGASPATTSTNRLSQSVTPPAAYGVTSGQGRVPITRLPQGMLDRVRNELGNNAIIGDAQWEIDNGRIIYKILASVEGRNVEFVFEENGTLLRRGA
jgi:hypothetical protein